MIPSINAIIREMAGCGLTGVAGLVRVAGGNNNLLPELFCFDGVSSYEFVLSPDSIPTRLCDGAYSLAGGSVVVVNFFCAAEEYGCEGCRAEAGRDAGSGSTGGGSGWTGLHRRWAVEISGGLSGVGVSDL